MPTVADIGKIFLLLKVQSDKVLSAASEAEAALRAVTSEPLGSDGVATLYLWGKSDLLLSTETTDLRLLSKLPPIPYVTRYNHLACYEWLTDLAPLEAQKSQVYVYLFVKFTPSDLKNRGLNLENVFVEASASLLKLEQAKRSGTPDEFGARFYGTVGWVDGILELSSHYNLSLLFDLIQRVTDAVEASGEGSYLFTHFSIPGYSVNILRTLLAEPHCSISEFLASSALESAHDDLFPSIQLRVQPSQLSSAAARAAALFADDWDRRIINGKNNLMLSLASGRDASRKGCSIGEFIFMSGRFMHGAGIGLGILNAETHFQFAQWPLREEVYDIHANPPCDCETRGLEYREVLSRLANADFVDTSVRNSLRSFLVLYSACLYEKFSCCYLADLLPYIGLLGRVLAGVSVLGPDFVKISALLRDASINGKRLINQRRSGNYEDILDAGDRVTIFKGGVQKIIRLLNGVVRETLGRMSNQAIAGRLPVIFRYSVLESIESQPHIGLVEIPIRYLFPVQQAAWQLWHEMGEIFWFHESPTDDLEIGRVLQQYTGPLFLTDQDYWDIAEGQVKEIFCDMFAVQFGFCLDSTSFCDLYLSELCEHIKSMTISGEGIESIEAEIVRAVTRLVAVRVHVWHVLPHYGSYDYLPPPPLPPFDLSSDSCMTLSRIVDDVQERLWEVTRANGVTLVTDRYKVKGAVLTQLFHPGYSLLPIICAFSEYFLRNSADDLTPEGSSDHKYPGVSRFSLNGGPLVEFSIGKALLQLANLELANKEAGKAEDFEFRREFFGLSVSTCIAIFSETYRRGW